MENQIAVLIDGDNISAKYAEYIKQEALQYGNVKIFRLYGSVNSKTVKAWYNVMPLQGIVPMLQISYANGKSIADQALTIDAMDLLYSADINIFCIVSSDSDFTKLVYRLKESGKTVVGMGEKKTKEALAKACDEFKILDLIYKEAESETDGDISDDIRDEDVEEAFISSETEENEAQDIPAELEIAEEEINVPTEDEVIQCIKEYMDDDETINLAEIGAVLKRKYLGFDARNYGYKSMTNMIKGHADCFDLKVQNARDGIHKIMYISKK